MLALFFVGIVLAVASLVTVVALANARDGYEDNAGFHRTTLNRPELQLGQDGSERSTTPLPPWAAAG